MSWDNVIELISESYETDEEGISKPIMLSTSVYARIKSVRQSEFYQAASSGRKPVIMFEVRSFEYDDQLKVSHGGKVYAIIRAYRKNHEITELTCEGEVINGG